MTDYIGKTFGSYRLLRILGKGSFADVYLGKHMYLKTEAAIKILYGRLDADTIQHFLTEAQLLREIEHPHIIRIHDANMLDGDVPYFVMDYASGGTLRDRHPKGTPLPFNTILTYVKQIAAALDYAHEHKLIHRDLKPENLLLDHNGEVLLSDFGVALPMRNTDSISVQAVGGTLAYMAPEQTRGKPRAASDQYALGIMVYEWLCGQRPFSGDTAELIGQHLFVPPPSLCAKIPDLPPQIEQVIFRALAKEHQQRFACIRDFADALEEASLGKEVTERFDVPFTISPTINELSTPRSPFFPRQHLINNLPTRLTRLIGRDHERDAACVMLTRPEVRLLTMTGPGGIGKTRLAVSVASDLQNAFVHGVCYVPLVTISDPDLLLSHIFQALGIKESETSTITHLAAVLRGQHMLLVLDNFEQIIDAAPIILDILEHCPNLKMLITSRILLHIPGEHTFPVPPLQRPDLKKAHATYASSPSVQLFCERAAEHDTDFQLTDENTRAIAEICARLDGLPLAIELAAARIQIMTPHLLLSRLKRRLDLLSSNAKSLPDRQQTIRKTIQWSYDLLNQQEQTLLQRLSVFIGGCRMTDIETFYTLLGEDPFSVMDDITHLLDNSLIYKAKQAKGEAHFHMLETIREFGLEQLETTGTLEKLRAAHASYYQSLMPENAPITFNIPENDWTKLVRSEFENMLAALHYLFESGQYKNALAFASSMGGLWITSGYMSLGLAELTRALQLCQEHHIDLPAIYKASALLNAGRAAMYIPSPLQAQALLQESVDLLRPLHKTPLFPIALVSAAILASDLGHYPQADKLLQEASDWVEATGIRDPLNRIRCAQMLRLYRGQFDQVHDIAQACIQLSRTAHDTWIEAIGLHYLGWVAYHQKAFQTARQHSEEAVAKFRSLNFPNLGLEALCVLAYEQLALDEPQNAQLLFEEALNRSREAGDTGDIAHALCGLAYLALHQGDLENAARLFEESITTLQQLKTIITRYKHILACAFEGLAQFAMSQHNMPWAACLLGVADAQRIKDPYYNPVGLDTTSRERIEAELRFALGAQTFATIRTTSQHMTPHQALAAKNGMDPSESFPNPLSPSTSSSPPEIPKDLPPIESLTRRETEVLKLLAEGYSNAEIADHLVLSVVTINSYLRSIYGKLGVSSRTRAIRMATEYQLIN